MVLWPHRTIYCLLCVNFLSFIHFLFNPLIYSFPSEYYFSPDNLARDFFLRRKMEADGTIPVTLIASFHRVRALTADVQLVLNAIRDSDKLQLIDGFKVWML